MAKKRFGVIVSAIMMMLTSCAEPTREQLFAKEGGSDRARARFEQVIEAITDQDRDTIISIFSEYVLNEAEDLDGGIDYLFATLPNGIDSWEKIGGGENVSRREGTRVSTTSYSWHVYVDDIEYVFSISEQTRDTEHPENVGVKLICLYINEKRGPDIPYGSIGIYRPEGYSGN